MNEPVLDLPGSERPLTRLEAYALGAGLALGAVPGVTLAATFYAHGPHPDAPIWPAFLWPAVALALFLPAGGLLGHLVVVLFASRPVEARFAGFLAKGNGLCLALGLASLAAHLWAYFWDWGRRDVPGGAPFLVAAAVTVAWFVAFAFTYGVCLQRAFGRRWTPPEAP